MFNVFIVRDNRSHDQKYANFDSKQANLTGLYDKVVEELFANYISLQVKGTRYKAFIIINNHLEGLSLFGVIWRCRYQKRNI